MSAPAIMIAVWLVFALSVSLWSAWRVRRHPALPIRLRAHRLWVFPWSVPLMIAGMTVGEGVLLWMGGFFS